VDAFRLSLGDPNNGNTAGFQAGGRREINWDGGGVSTVADVPTPGLTFQNRGFVFTTPGTGFQFNPDFGDLNPSYPTLFAEFSPLRLFAPLGSNVTDGTFNEPGDVNTPATTTGFGAVFTDVDLADTTSIEYFDPNGNSLGEFFVPAGPGDETLSFLGVIFDAGEQIGRVRITTGTGALGANDGEGVDNVVMDDFLYREPTALGAPVIPLPSAALMVLTTVPAMALAGAIRRRLKRHRR
jgi:hypothetical protein